MKYKSIIIIALVIIFNRCTITNITSIPSRDEKKIELLLSKYKKEAFLELYRKSIHQAERKYKLQKCDSLFDVTEMILVNDNCLAMRYYTKEKPNYFDYNYNKMIKKWLNKDYLPEMPVDNSNVKTISEFRRVFDFYESKDLEQYIDSLRQSFYKKYKKNDLDLSCLEEFN